MERKIGFLGLVNYKDHPSNKNYKIFSFYSSEESSLFEKMLINENINYEKDYDNKLYLFAIEQNKFEKVIKINSYVYLKYKKPFISNKIIRLTLLIFFISILVFAISGFIISNFM